jgi:NodT family efflux transporter outer membrane factor (OMF) lipoprotein
MSVRQRPARAACSDTGSAMWLALALSPFLAGCDLGPDYVKPTLEVPAAYRASPATAATAWPATDWWSIFGSPELDRLIAEARQHNFDLAAAIARVEEANAQVSISGAPLLPTINGVGTAEAVQTPKGPGTAVTVGNVNRKSYSTTHLYSLEAQATYLVDFWGQNRAALESAQASLLASTFDQQTVALTVESSVATTWFQALGFNDRLNVARSNLADSEKILAAIRARLAAGTATALDVAQQQALVEGVRANIPNFQSQVEQQVIALGILTGRPPESVDAKPGSLQDILLLPIGPGLPSDLLLRRPDVANAEAQLVAQNANIKVARAAFFPQVNLTLLGGLQSAALGTLFVNSLASEALGTVTQTIFDNGLKEGQFAQAKARYEELVADYRKSVVQAFTDVDTALTAVQYATEQQAQEQRAVDVAQRAVDIAKVQLAAGTVDVTTVLTTEQTLFADQDLLAQVRLVRAQALVNLYKALGGGWTMPATEASTPTAATTEASR